MNLDEIAMEVRTFRASTMHEALMLVRRELGPDAAVIHTREAPPSGLFGWLSGHRGVEVTASLEVNVPSRLPTLVAQPPSAGRDRVVGQAFQPDAPGRERAFDGICRMGKPDTPICQAGKPDVQIRQAGKPDLQTVPLSSEVQDQLSELRSMVRSLCRQSQDKPHHELPEGLFRLFTELIDAELSEDQARDLVERIRGEIPPSELGDPALLKARVARMIEAEIRTSGPIAVIPGQRRLVALVGPTGVGKTTTIAKLAANYRLKEKRRVGLITVDTYRIAAVEQLRTYADIIDLPMQVVSTPREMREAVARMQELDLVLMDTAGRSPKDEVKIQELKTFLAEARADEVHLVLSSVAGSRTLEQTAERFAAAGTTALILTKLDEATGVANVLPVLRSSGLPLSYLTNGQSVPDDMETADAGRLARMILGMESPTRR